MAYKSGNPALNKKTFDNLAAGKDSSTMTLEGVTNKSLLLLAVAVGFGSVGWQQAASDSTLTSTLLVGGIVVTLVIALITTFKKTWSPVTAPIYAVLEGVVLGIISQIYND